MADWFTLEMMRSTTTRQTMLPQTLLRLASAALVAASLWAMPVLAKDPFRTTNARPISDRTEAAFKAYFEQGNYKTARTYLEQAEPNEPLALAMRASLAYLDWDGERDKQKKPELLERFRASGMQTREAAQKLMATDPLRGNLYTAVGYFFEGAYAITKDGTVKGTPQALNALQQVFKYLDAAEKVSPNDPELNLVKGYIDLFTALNLPFSSPNDAIDRLEKYAAPRYLADRGMALGYRDLNELPKALAAVNRALQQTPDNPELNYLKAQILVKQGNNREGITYFEKALTKQDQLPAGLVKQITRERDRTNRRLSKQQ
jgi:tetratricopeptide (TPR) repeat protein